VTVQLALDLDAAQNGAGAPPARPDGRTHADRPCARCNALSASPTAPATGAQCLSCRLAADRAAALRRLRWADPGGPEDHRALLRAGLQAPRGGGSPGRA